MFVAGDFFDTEVACGERWGLEPMSRLRLEDRWTVAFELHRHGAHVCSSTPELNCDLLRLRRLDISPHATASEWCTATR